MQSGISNGTISVCRFVKKVGSTSRRIAQAGAGERVCGVSQMAARRDSYVDSTDPPRAAIAGEPCGYFDDNEECRLRISTAVNVDDLLKSDANGMGTPALSDQDDVGAVALEHGSAGDTIRVKVRIQERSTA
jgi:hypothetical protein